MRPARAGSGPGTGGNAIQYQDPGSPVAGLDEVTAGTWGAGNETMRPAVAPLAADRRFRTLTHPEVFTAVLQTVPARPAWREALDPVS